MDKKDWINKKTEFLIKKEKYSPAQAYAIANSLFEKENKQQGGKVVEKMAPQRPIKMIQPVSTEGWRDNNLLPPGDYQKVYYVDPKVAKVENQDYEYLNSSGYGTLQRMNNYRIYMENKNKPVFNPPVNQVVDEFQQGGNTYAQQGYNSYTQQFAPLYEAQEPTLTQQSYQYQNAALPNTMQLPNFGSNGFQYNPNVVNTQDTTVGYEFQPQTPNPLAADAGSGYRPETNVYAPPQLPNPYGMSLEQSFRLFGEGLGENNSSKTALGGSLSALKLGRVGLGGYAYGKENKRVQDDYLNNLYRDNRTSTNFQQGGSVTNSEVMTGAFAVENPNGGNITAEQGEILKNNQTGNIQEIVGNDHKNGGVEISVEDGKILSDFTKIGAKTAKELKDRYKISLKKTDTFATAMDKINKQLGVDKLVEEQAKIIEKIGDNNFIKDETTRALNDGVLQKQVDETEEKLEALKGAQNFAFEDIFEMQESTPKRGNGQLINEDGSPMEVVENGVVAQEGGNIMQLAKKHGISQQRAMELLQMGGEVSQEPTQQIPSPEEIIQAFAQATQQDPQVIVAQLQQLSPEEQQQALQSMITQLQQPTEQAIPQEEMMQAGGQTNNYLQNSTLLTDFTNPPSVLDRLPYTPRETNPNQIWRGENYSTVWKPLVEQSLTNPEQAKKIDSWLMANKDTFAPNIQKQLEGLTGEKRIDRIKKLATDEKPGLFHNAVLEAIKVTAPEVATPAIAATTERPQFNQGQVVSNENTISPDTTTGFTPYITPPSERKGVILETTQAPQYDRVKRSFEAGQAALDNQLNTREEQIIASGLSPQIQQSLMANEAANIASAQNQNIASVEAFNAQNQQEMANRQADVNFKANLFNVNQRDVYFQRNTAAQDNAELSQKAYNDSLNKVGQQQQQDAFNRSLINASAERYRVNADGSLTFLPPQTGFVQGDNTLYNQWYDKLSAPEQEKERIRRAQELNGLKKQNANSSRKS
ncbi:MAG TPA: hypothetical protein VLA48_03375 [Nitrososphaeraceae archaeon]|nr:hypothetical protein [Nitrososphaeraceae archaeon]